MFRAFSRAVAQLPDPPVARVVWRSVAAAILIFIALITTIGWTLANTAWLETGWLEDTVDLFGGLATVILAIVLFPGVVSALVSVFLEDVADAVEAKYYPGLPKARDVSWGELIGTGARLIGWTVLLNLLVLPLYLIPVVNLAVYYGLNGYLLSREYFEVVALRRMGVKPARDMRRRHRGYLWLAGAATTFLLTVPVVNMIAPVIGAAAMVHLFHALNGGQTDDPPE